MSFVSSYKLFSLLFALLNIYAALKCLSVKDGLSRYLAATCFMAAAVDVSYLFSILATDYLMASVFSSLYFFGISLMLNCLAFFVWHFVRSRPRKPVRLLWYVSCACLLFELAVFAINPFREISIHYLWRDTPISHYAYAKMPLYNLHLLYSYALVAFVLLVLVQKLVRTPRDYRLPYIYSLLSILVVVAINAIFLFLPDLGLLSLVDVSVCLYSLVCILLYWSFYGMARISMQNHLKNMVFDNIHQALVLFDYQDRMILVNNRAKQLLRDITLARYQPLNAFLEQSSIQLPENISGGYVLQCFLTGENEQEEHPLRCEYRPLTNEYGQRVGKLFSFSDASFETDPLTGFQNWESYKRLMQMAPPGATLPSAVGICDITGLALMNSLHGRSAGDQALREVATLIRRHFPANSYFVRGRDAHLMVMCYMRSEEDILENFRKVEAEYSGNVQYAAGTVDHKSRDVLDAISKTNSALHNRKLMNKESIHHSALKSLMSALQECDADTEAHVRRTQEMGRMLGEKMNFSDEQRSNLDLLCMLHDIGKIGVPLEILNKPGKLTNEEWQLIQTHVEKGYQIALSSPDFSGIAEMILHHHERWDGKGYPSGLSRESIPMLSRVIAVVDSFDAMVNNRSYRRARTYEEAVAELRRCAGSQFDPAVVSAFLQVLEEHEELHIGANAAEAAAEEDTQTTLLHVDVYEEPSVNTATSVHPIHYARYTLDENNAIIDVDEAFTAITGYTMEDIQKWDLHQIDLIPLNERTSYLTLLNEQLAARQMAYVEHPLRKKNGTNILVLCFGRIYYDSVARKHRSEIIFYNSADTHAMQVLANEAMNKAHKSVEKWERTYRTDSLTGLLTHKSYVNDVELVLLKRERRVLFLMMDLDNFKNYNDTRGHLAGDELLVLFAQILKETVGSEYVCRMGGDEYSAAILLPTDTTEKKAGVITMAIYDRIATGLRAANSDVTFSLGSALSKDSDNFNKLYEAADAALYRVKAGGKGRAGFGS